MSPNQQRIAIAEACGFLNPRFEDGSFKASVGKSEDGRFWGTSGIPDYLADLNAMHEAEALIYPNFETATDDEMRTWMRYRKQLGKVAMVNCQEGAGLDERLIRATAAERAESFCRVMFPERFEP